MIRLKKVRPPTYYVRHIHNLKHILVLESVQKNSDTGVRVGARNLGGMVERILYCEVVV